MMNKRKKIITAAVALVITMCTCGAYPAAASDVIYSCQSSKKNIALTVKIRHMTKKTTRARVMSYLSEVAAETGKNTFEIPFNRQEMADYLAVERSALSATLSGMQAEGLITFRKNRFTLHAEIGEKA